jgi:hypothetical protein
MAAVAVLPLAIAAPAYAQATRTWVSGVGDDANPCSRTAPCKTFAGAISKTARGGEISVLDPGGFGAVTITKGITISADGTLGSILASSVNGINVACGAGNENDVVIIRNISINGAGGASGANTGLSGISYTNCRQLTVEKVTIEGFTVAGIRMAVPNGGELIINDTTITDSAAGISVNTTAGQALVTVDNTRIQNMTGTGIETLAGSAFAAVNVFNSNISHNNSDGLKVSGPNGQITVVDSALVFNNASAVNCAGNGGRFRLARNVIANNANGVSIGAGCTVLSAGNNSVDGSSTTPNGTFSQQ